MKHRAFTLIEVVVGTALVALVLLGIYRFLELSLSAMAAGAEMSDRDVVLESLSAVVGDELRAVPPDTMGGIAGEPHKFNNLPSDEIEWPTGPGNGLFTRHASGQYRVRLMLRPVEKTSRDLELGLKRMPVGGAGDTGSGDWLPMLREVAAMEIRYYDARINSWVDKWTDAAARPALVRLRIWRTNERFPYETVYALPNVTRPDQRRQGG